MAPMISGRSMMPVLSEELGGFVSRPKGMAASGSMGPVWLHPWCEMRT